MKEGMSATCKKTTEICIITADLQGVRGLTLMSRRPDA
jgi:hypothetical protein